MFKKIVTLYIDDASLRLVITDGKRVEKWAELPLEPGLVRSNVIVKEAEVAAKIKQLLEAQKVKAKKVIVGLSGLHCLSRPLILPQMPKAMQDEAVIQEARKVLPVPLEQLYISWQTIPAPEGKIQVFFIAIPRKTADVLLRVLREVQLVPHFLDIKPLALARVVREPTAMIVDIQPTEFDIIIMADGVPQPIRTVPFPSEALPWSKKLPLIKNDLDRTIKFYNSNNPENTLASSVPIYISGELADEPELCQSLSDELGYPVLPLSSTLEYPEQFNLSRYMVNIGLALKELSSGRETGLAVVNLNALPAAYRPKPFSLTRVIAVPSAVVVVGLVVSLVMLIQGASASIVSTHNQLDATYQLIKQKQLREQELTENIAELEGTIAGLEAAHDTFTTALDSLIWQRSMVNGNLEVAAYYVPLDITLTSINQAGSTLTINGTSSSETEILDYARKLDLTTRFSEVTVANVRRTADEAMEFTLVLRTKG